MYYVYEHFDPRTKEVVYIGKGTAGRAWSLQRGSADPTRHGGRHHAHFKWASTLLAKGYTPDQFVRIVSRNLTNEAALECERAAIALERPRFNLRCGGHQYPHFSLAKARKLRAQGMPYQAIGKRLGCATMTAYRYLNGKSWKGYE